jgi:hypothetical protein
MNRMPPKQPMSRSIWRIALLARECGRNFWNCAPASGPRTLLPCARWPARAHSGFRAPGGSTGPRGEPPHWRWMTIAARHPAGGFGCTEYRSVPFAHFQPGSGRAGRLIKPRAIADGSTLLGRAVVRSAHGEAMVRWQAGLLADETKVENAPSPRTLASWHATRRGSPSFNDDLPDVTT